MGFDESKWACRNLYIATFPQTGSCWSGKELEEIHIMDLLLEAGWEDPKTTLDAAQHSGGVPPELRRRQINCGAGICTTCWLATITA